MEMEVIETKFSSNNGSVISSKSCYERLSVDNINPRIKKFEYAATISVVTAAKLEKSLKEVYDYVL